MAKSSIKYQKATSHLKKHNGREDEPSYLLPQEFRTEPNVKWEAEISAKDFFVSEVAKTNRKGGRIPKFENSHWEAVLNLNDDHGLTDCQAVAEHIEKKFNIKCHSIYIHKDEGHLRHKETGKELSGGIDYYTKNGVSYYIKDKKKTNEPLDLSEYEPIYNYHAHLEFTTYKDKKQNWQQGLVRPKLMQLQSEVAEILKMERGETNTKKRGLSHHEFKQEQHAIQNAIEPIKKELFNTKEALEQLRKDSKNQGFTAEYFRELNKAKKELTFKDQEAFEIWKQDLIERHTKKGVFRDKTDTEAVLTEQFEKIEQLNAINQATEKSKEQEIEAEKERLKKEQEQHLQELRTQEIQRLNAEYEDKEKKLKAKTEQDLENYKNEFLATQQRKENALISKELTLNKRENDLNEREQELNQDSFMSKLKAKIQELTDKVAEKAEQISQYLLKITNLEKENNDLKTQLTEKDTKINELESDLKAEKDKNNKLQALNTQNALNAKETPLNDKEKIEQEIENGEYLYFKERENQKSGESKYIFFTKTQHKNYVANQPRNFDDTRKLSELYSYEKNEVIEALVLYKQMVKIARKIRKEKEPPKINRGLSR